MSPDAVRARRLSVCYPGAADPAPRELDLRVPEGSFSLVLGPSGSGKSSLLLCLNGLIPHSLPARREGHLEVLGQDPAGVDLAECCRRAGLVLQDPSSQFATLSVEDEVAFGPENLALPLPEVEARVESALHAQGLAHLRSRRPGQLSGGEQQRLALASVLAMDPRILLLDEPTANLDAATASACLESLRSRAGQHTLVLVEHRADSALRHAADVVALSRDGACLAAGPPRRLVDEAGDALLAQGLWLPHPTEMALELRGRGLWTGGIPLTVEEAAPEVARLLALQPEGGAAPPDTPGGAPGRVVAALWDVCFTYQQRGPAESGDAQAPLLRTVNLELREGEVLGLAGPNGSGKTTLALCLLGLLTPTSGRVEVLGRPPRGARAGPSKGEAGMVFQNPEHQFLTHRVADELALGPRALGLAEAEVERRVSEALERFHLAGLADRHPYRLSWGQKRRLSLAALLVMRQRLLVLDEPTFGQDRRGTQEVLREIRALAEDGVSLLVISHDPDQLLEVCDRLAVLREGRLVACDEPWRVLSDSGLREAGSLTMPASMRLHQAVSQMGAAPPRLRSTAEWVDHLSGRAG